MHALLNFLPKHKGVWVLVGFGLLLPLASSCDRVSVTSVAVATVDVVPSTAELVTGQALQLSALALDGSGAQLSTAGVQWSASPDEIVQVDASGRLVALAPGTATISATTGGVVGTAQVSVGTPGFLELNTTELAFSAIVGETPPPAQTVQIGAGNSGTVLGLATTVLYESGATGWLTATLSSDRAPATLTLRPAGDLGVGDYSARVQITSNSATNSPLEISVSLVVEKPVILLSTSSLSIQGSGVLPVQVQNGGAGQLSGLTAAVEFPAGSPTGWLTAALSSTSAPTTLNITSNDLALPPGSYTARVMVSSSSPAVDDVFVDVTLQGGQFAPRITVAPDTVFLTAVLGDSATLGIAVTNTGTGALTGLRRTIGYNSGQPTGWFRTSFSRTSAPAVLTTVATTAGLTPGSYSARLQVLGTATNSPVTVPVLFTVTPVPIVTPAGPSSLTAVLSGSPPTAVTLGWKDNSTNETGFEVRRRTTGGAWQTIATPTTNAQSYSDAAVTAGSTYDYRVRACNTAGCSAWSNTASVTVPVQTARPNTPGRVSLNPLSANDMEMVWPDNSSNETSFQLQRRGPTGGYALIATLPTNVANYHDKGLQPGTEYRYRVRACNSAGCSSYGGVGRASTTNPTTIPKSPINLAIVSASRQQVVLQWTDVSTDETHFVIEEGSLTTSWAAIGQVGVNATTFTDTNVRVGVQIHYRVRACNPVGCSGAFTVTVTVP